MHVTALPNMMKVLKYFSNNKVFVVDMILHYRPLASVGVAMNVTCSDTPLTRACRAKDFRLLVKTSEYFLLLDLKQYLQKLKID